MIIGVVKEIKSEENRVGLTPHCIQLLNNKGHKVYIEKGAGIGSGFADEEYAKEGAVILNSPEEVYQISDMIVKVKEPQPCEYKFLKKEQIIFTYLHLAVEKVLTTELINKKITSIAYETIETEDKKLPLLIPMSEIAGRMSVQIAANLLENRNNGSGILLSGVAGVPAGKVLIVGAGSVGINAAKIAVGMGANVCVADIDTQKLRVIEDKFGSQVKTYISTPSNLSRLIKEADVVIGAVLIPGHKAPVLITEDMVKSMKKGSVIIDVSIDQGGIVETMDRITTHKNPTYEKYGVIHYCVSNMPGSVARTSTLALTNETIKYILKIADNGLVNSIKTDAALAKGVNTFKGFLTNKGVAEAHNLEYTEIPSLIGF